MQCSKLPCKERENTNKRSKFTRGFCFGLVSFSFMFFLQPMEVFVDDETKLTLHGLQQYYCKLKDSEKNRKLFDLLDVLEFNQVNLRARHLTRCRHGAPQVKQQKTLKDSGKVQVI